MKLILDEKVEQKIRAHGEETYPFECCGFLYGKDEGGYRKIIDYREANNSKKENKRRRFSIEALEYLEAENYALEHDLELLGIYHSHPDHPSIPSEEDRRQAMPFFSYAIVSIQKGKSKELTSWLLNEEQKFEQQKLNEILTFTPN